jgi:hypothetical protein
MHRYQEDDVPAEVREVRRIAQASADRGLASTIASKAVYCSKQRDGTWQIADNFERFSSSILEWKDGRWTIRSMFSEERPRKISQGEAEANAQLMFCDH